MRNFLAFIGLVLVAFVAIGFYRGWFSVSVDSDKNFTIRGDGSKIIQDTKAGGEILGDKIRNGVDNLKKDDAGTPSPATTAGPAGR